MIYSGIFLVINAALIYVYFKFLKLEGKKRLYLFLFGFPFLNFTVITLLLMIFHSKYSNEFSEPLSYIEYQLTEELRIDPAVNYQRSLELIDYLNQPSTVEIFRQFDLPIDVNKSQEFIVDNILKTVERQKVDKQTLDKQIKLLLEDPTVTNKAFFACIPNVKKGKLADNLCQDLNFEKTFALFAKVILILGMQGRELKNYEDLVLKISGLFQMQDELAGTDVGASYQDDFFKFKLRFFNLFKILVSHHKVNKKFQSPLRQAVKKLFPRDKEANIKRWRYVNVIFDQHMRQKKLGLLEQMNIPIIQLPQFQNWKEYWKIYQSKIIPLKAIVLRYLRFTGSLGFLINTEVHKQNRETYINNVLSFIKRRTQFTRIDMEFEARRAVRFERNTLTEVLQKHLIKNKPLLNFYGRYEYFDFMKERGFKEFRRIWEIEFFLEEAVDFVAD